MEIKVAPEAGIFLEENWHGGGKHEITQCCSKKSCVALRTLHNFASSFY